MKYNDNQAKKCGNFAETGRLLINACRRMIQNSMFEVMHWPSTGVKYWPLNSEVPTTGLRTFYNWIGHFLCVDAAGRVRNKTNG